MEQTTDTKGQSRKKLPIILITAVVAVALAVSAVLLVVTGYKATVTKFMDAYLEGDGGTMFVLALPDGVQEKEYLSEASREKAIEGMNAQLQEKFSKLDEKYDQWSMTFRLSDAEKLAGDSLREIREYYQGEYDLKVAAARTMTVTLTYCADGEEYTVEAEAVVMRLGLRWYVDLAHSTLNRFFSPLSER